MINIINDIYIIERWWNAMHYTKPYQKRLLTGAVMSWMACSWYLLGGLTPVQAEGSVFVTADRAQEEAKYNSQQVQIITKKDIELKQAKSVEDIVFTQAGVSRTVDSMGRVGVSIRGAEPRHTLILVDGQPVMGEFAKYQGQGDELQRLGTENVERIEIIQGAASAKYGSDAIGGVINVITNKPNKNANIRINGESIRSRGDQGLFPYSNFFMRADSGQQGKLRVNIHGSKRDIVPVYAARERKEVPFGDPSVPHRFPKNSLRYYGANANIGLSAIYDVNDKNSFSFTMDRYNEDLERYVKRTNSEDEPQVHYKRDLDRNKINFSYAGSDEKNNWKVELNSARTKEDDVTLTSEFGNSNYEGKNTLNYVDNVDHKQWSLNVTGDTQANENHLLSYGFGYTTESGEGSRLKSAPHTWVRNIDPWDYDKSLAVKKGKPSSTIYRHSFDKNSDGSLRWNKEHEWYGYDGTINTSVPEFTYEDFKNYLDPEAGLDESAFMGLVYDSGGNYTPNNLQRRNPEAFKRFEAFNERLKQIPYNQELVAKYGPGHQGSTTIDGVKPPIINLAYLALFYYMEDPSFKIVRPQFNGGHFKDEYNKRINQQTVGSARLRKQHFFIQDTWQVNKNTILQPIARLDHSDLFGSHMTFNMGVTHNVKGNAHRRLKANIGTSYTEPGMGEMYYNWEMYGPTVTNVAPLSGGRARLGWYWIGNPDLKPETSKNIDISFEGENKNTYFKLTAFRNQITNYMTIANTGHIIDFHPYLNESTYMGATKFEHAPDMIYTFKNIGKARINGLELELKQRLNEHFKFKFGYTYLNAINKTNPDLPRRLLDKPMHKLDLGLEFEDKKSGWSGNIWADYYYKMLDSNSVSGGGNYITSQKDPDNDDKSIITYEFNTKKTADMYKLKSYGIWNMIVQKKINKYSLVYFGINNIFDHRDDDRALQGRQYRFGMNLKFGASSETKDKVVEVSTKVIHDKNDIIAMTPLNTFVLEKPFDEGKEKGITFIGDLRMGGDSHLGSDRPSNRVTAVSSISDGALKNLLDKNEHGFHTRLRLGANARVNDTTNVKLLITAQGQNGVDTSHEMVGSKGIQHSRVEELDLTKHHAKWDYSVGRMKERMGATGYWFNEEFDGLRTVWTSDKDQVRIGFGDFSRSTGIQDSSYTHAIYTKFKRPPTVDEFVGTSYDYSELSEEDRNRVGGAKVEKVVKDAPNTVNFYQQLKKLLREYKELSAKKDDYTTELDSLKDDLAGNGWVTPTEEEKVELRAKIEAKTKELEEITTKWEANVDAQYGTLARMQDIVIKAYGNDKAFTTVDIATRTEKEITIPIKMPKLNYTLKGKSQEFKYDDDGDLMRGPDGNPIPAGPATESSFKQAISPSGNNINNPIFKLKLKDIQVLGKNKKEFLAKWFKENKAEILKGYDEEAKRLAIGAFNGGVTGVELTDDSGKVGDELYKNNYLETDGSPQDHTIYNTYDSDMYPYLIAQYFNKLVSVLEATDAHSRLPREALTPYTGAIIPAKGIVLQRDTIPPIKGAGFIQLRHMVGKQMGISAWYLRSLGNDEFSMAYASGLTTSSKTLRGMANVIGIGANYRMGQATVSFDYGQNRTDLGRFMNGRTIYDYVPGSINFTPTGRTNGGNPTFWAVRFDVGQSDMSRPGSWNGFIDYKSFDHGSFFGGNGTGAVPDRYLDGIRSFTVGGGYVPWKDVLLEASYTFDAKAIGQRDTLYGAENFKLGNYTRIQGTYRF